MSVLDHFLVAVVGYVLAAVLQTAGIQLSHGETRPRRRTGVGLRIAAGVVTTVVTTSWLLPASLSGGVIGGVFMFVFLFMFVPFVVIYVGQLLGRMRQRRGAAPIWPAVLIGAFALVCLVPGTKVAADGLMHLTGLAQPVELHVTKVVDRNVRPGKRAFLDDVSGDYVLDGRGEHVQDSVWLSWHQLPKEGATIPVTISRLWPSMMIEDDAAAWWLAGLGGFGIAAGGVLMAWAVREKTAEQEETAGP
ncbi:hypothetical protein HFP15_26225 [Amycolatopsis sp. K13G38]|uniref:Cytochrome c-type biogenesis protein CcmF C-terminal domain-containing protein n=1 Tax=Amycolatopsis acididurans TaxID=2724524 RepID=A0ABX1JDC5_9PSEU|nr:hypothetical protein [Amycolatopsis acididurans]NKQ56380.1 hypothetical protein [Amycolatopsis acididurans]